MKHANSILETFEYFRQISSKLIHIISSYTVSKLGPFFETQCSILGYLHSVSAFFHSAILPPSSPDMADNVGRNVTE